MKAGVTVHGFRSGFRDWSAECTGYAHEVAEMALAHTIENKVEPAYRRGDLFEKRRRLMVDWATYCASGGDRKSVVEGKSVSGRVAHGGRRIIKKKKKIKTNKSITR